MASSSSTPNATQESVGEEYPYPYPSHVCAPNFVTLKLSGRDEYGIWQTQMLCLLESHGMLGFINGAFTNPQISCSVFGKERVGDHQTHMLWRRSDALVKGWILGSLTKQTLGYLLKRVTEKFQQERNAAANFNSKDVWDELQSMYAPAVLPQVLVIEDTMQDQATSADHEELYECTLGRHDWESFHEILERGRVTVIDKITINGNTAIHVAVAAAKQPELLEKMLGLIPENIQLLDFRNLDGSTLLHVAAIVGNTEASKILLARNRDLLLVKDNEGHTPLALALSNMHTETARHMLQHIIDTGIQKDIFSGQSGDQLLVTVISSKDFVLANDMVGLYTNLHSDSVLMTIAQNFPYELNILEKYLGNHILREEASQALEYIRVFHYMMDYFRRYGPLLGVVLAALSTLFIYGYYLSYWIMKLFKLILRMLVLEVWPSMSKRVRIHPYAIEVLINVCCLIHDKNHSSSYHHYHTNPILEATRQNAFEVVYIILYYFPHAISSANKDGHNIIQYAVINRSEKVYNYLLYQMSEQRNIYRTIKDTSGNNLLHLAARLAPTNKLNLISGAALQIQNELQWFKEIEGFVCPLEITQKNLFDETPQMTFTREHKDLVIEGEKWMKATAESYTITTALIITIVFAAAITVPGGTNQDTGIPVFTKNTAFRIFEISDAISLFSAVTSLLMFLSILTARFAEQDFLLKLPTKLIIGLATLFISTTSMIVAFGATLYLVFGQSNSKILIPIGVLTCLPITCFVTLQFPLILDLMSATYGHSIFRKKNDSPFRFQFLTES